MGLHQQNNISLDRTSEKAIERNHTFWVLYIVDKTISLTMGQACCLPMYDCDVASPNQDAYDHFHKHFVARLELAAMREDSYQTLYSSQARRRGDFVRSSSISHLDHKLALGASKHGDLREDIRNESGTSSPSHSLQVYASTALDYHFYMTRVLVHNAVKRASDKRQCCSDARACIKLLQRLSMDYVPGACTIMSRQLVFFPQMFEKSIDGALTRKHRIYGDHPLIPFFILFANVIQEPQTEQSTQDARLMATAADILQQSQRFESSRACVAQLLLCSQAINAFTSGSTSPTSSISLTSINSTTSTTKPLTINTDPFHNYTELAGRKRNKLNTASRNTSWTNIAQSARSQRSATDFAGISEQELSRPESWNYEFSNPPDMIAPSGSLGLDYESPLSMNSRRGGLDPSTGQLNEHQQQQQQMEHPQLNMGWAEDSGGYAMAFPPQLGPRWPTEVGMGYFGEEFAPRRSEQWLS